jgi:hypothetical protein
MTPITPVIHSGQQSRNRFAPLPAVSQILKNAGLRSMILVLLAAPFLAAQTASTTAKVTPFQQQLVLSINNGGTGVFAPVAVPAGKRMCIEYVSMSGSAPTGQRLSASIQTTVGNVSAAYSIVHQVQETTDGIDKLVANQMMKIYAETPELHIAILRAKTDGPAQITINISGFLETVDPNAVAQ